MLSRSVLLLIMGMGMASCSRSNGTLSKGAEYWSPDRQRLAAFYALSGGGAGGWAAEYVSIRRPGEDLESSDVVLEMTHGYQACLRWATDNRLVIELPPEASVVRHANSSHGVEVSFAEAQPDGNCDGCAARLSAEWAQCSG